MHSRNLPVVLLLCFAASASLAGTVDPPIRVSIKKLDRTDLAGQITHFDEKGFDFMDYKKQTNTFAWDEFDPNTIKMLLAMPGGRDPANTAFGRALRLDKSFKERIDAARKEAKLVDPATRPATR